MCLHPIHIGWRQAHFVIRLHTAEVAALWIAHAIAFVSAQILYTKHSRSHCFAQLMLEILAADLRRSLPIIYHGL